MQGTQVVSRTVRCALAMLIAMAALAPPTLAGPPFAIIDNGTVQLGVHCEGHLNVPGGVPSSGTGTTFVGLRFLPTGAEATAPGCLCEGWGAADPAAGITGGGNEAYGGTFNLFNVGCNSTPNTAMTSADVDGILRVTHDYHPTVSPFLYEVTVTLTNISAALINDVRYRRVMDWDVEPTAFREFVTLDDAGAANLIFSSDDGFASWNPLTGPSQILFSGSAVDSGPADHGALFDFSFGPLSPGGTITFQTYYGAAPDEASADAARAALGILVYSYGQPNVAGGPNLGIPNTFIFGFKGVGECPEDADPASQGYWHRQCLGLPAGDPDCPGIDPGRNGRGPTAPTEPDFCPDLTTCADTRLEDLGFFGTLTCDGMDADPASDKCEKATKQLTALILNVCSGRLSDGCEVDVSAEGCSSTSVGALIDELAQLIQDGFCDEANACAGAVNEGDALVGGGGGLTDPPADEISIVPGDEELGEEPESPRLRRTGRRGARDR